MRMLFYEEMHHAPENRIIGGMSPLPVNDENLFQLPADTIGKKGLKTYPCIIAGQTMQIDPCFTLHGPQTAAAEHEV